MGTPGKGPHRQPEARNFPANRLAVLVLAVSFRAVLAYWQLYPRQEVASWRVCVVASQVASIPTLTLMND
jgi:hypothetical protein